MKFPDFDNIQTILLVAFLFFSLFAVASFLTREQVEPEVAKEAMIETISVNDDSVCFYLMSGNNTLAEVTAVGASEQVEGVTYGETKYNVQRNTQNKLCYQPRPHDFPLNNTYFLSVNMGDEKFKSEEFTVRKPRLFPVNEVQQFVSVVLLGDLHRAMIYTDWARTQSRPDLFLKGAFVTGVFVLSFIAFAFLLYGLWRYKNDIGSIDIDMGIVPLVLALWLVGDGLFSILIYREQTPYEHIIRIIRILVGMYFLLNVWIETKT